MISDDEDEGALQAKLNALVKELGTHLGLRMDFISQE